MDKKPYHHLPDGTFRNPEGSPIRIGQGKFSYTKFIKLKKKIDMTVPKEHLVNKEKVLSDLEKYKKEDYIAWIGHATYLIKLGDTTIITDPVFSKNAGPLIFGPDRFIDPALNLDEIPKTDLLLLTIIIMTIKIWEPLESFHLKIQKFCYHLILENTLQETNLKM